MTLTPTFLSQVHLTFTELREKVSKIFCNIFYLECEYGGPLQAMLAGDFASVSLLADGAWKIPR